MAEDLQPLTLQQRIASLNAAHIGRIAGEPPLLRPKPQAPQKRPIVVRQKSMNNPPEQLNGYVTDARVGNQPAAGEGYQHALAQSAPVRENPRASVNTKTPPPLPKRQPSQPPPPLPSRQGSYDNSRRGSDDSLSSGAFGDGGSDGARLVATRTRSNDSGRIKAPAWGDCELPALPPKGTASAPRKFSSDRPKYVNRAPSVPPAISTPTLSSENDGSSRRPSLPPRLPSRKTEVEQSIGDGSIAPIVNGVNHKMPPPMPSTIDMERIKRSTFSYGLNKTQPVPPSAEAITKDTEGSHRDSPAQPPPIPLSSRPDLAAIQACKPRAPVNAVSVGHSYSGDSSASCLVCRDFSAPDHYATLFPRSQVTSLQTLAIQLTSPFPSATDKARAIFTWLHHNIRYDVVSFFGGNVQPSTPLSTLQSGLAVCEGYAALFSNLATHAGLESVVISGHGKGFGFTPLNKGAPLPPYSAGHAWNAVKIDNEEWKLIDCCWGAGHVQGKGQPYVQMFHEEQFTMSNEEFAVKHFPGNKDHFFLPGGHRMSWEEYIQIDPAAWPSLVEPPTIFTNARQDYGIGGRTVLPRSRKLMPSQGGCVRFQFSLLCSHWTLERHTKKGPPPVFVLAVHGVDGRNKDHIPLEHVKGPIPGEGGDLWYADVPARELGAPGQTVTLFAVTSFGGRGDARGLTVREFREGKGRVGMGFMGVAAWDLV